MPNPSSTSAYARAQESGIYVTQAQSGATTDSSGLSEPLTHPQFASLSARNPDQTERCKYSSKLPKLTHVVYREARIALQERASRSNLSVTTSSMRSGSKGDFSVFPRIDALPPILRVERQRAMSQAAQRSTSLASMASELRDYPPNSTFPFTFSYHVFGGL